MTEEVLVYVIFVISIVLTYVHWQYHETNAASIEAFSSYEETLVKEPILTHTTYGKVMPRHRIVTRLYDHLWLGRTESLLQLDRITQRSPTSSSVGKFAFVYQDAVHQTYPSSLAIPLPTQKRLFVLLLSPRNAPPIETKVPSFATLATRNPPPVFGYFDPVEESLFTSLVQAHGLLRRTFPPLRRLPNFKQTSFKDVQALVWLTEEENPRLQKTLAEMFQLQMVQYVLQENPRFAFSFPNVAKETITLMNGVTGQNATAGTVLTYPTWLEPYQADPLMRQVLTDSIAIPNKAEPFQSVLTPYEHQVRGPPDEVKQPIPLLRAFGEIVGDSRDDKKVGWTLRSTVRGDLRVMVMQTRIIDDLQVYAGDKVRFFDQRHPAHENGLFYVFRTSENTSSALNAIPVSFPIANKAYPPIPPEPTVFTPAETPAIDLGQAPTWTFRVSWEELTTETTTANAFGIHWSLLWLLQANVGERVWPVDGLGVFDSTGFLIGTIQEKDAEGMTFAFTKMPPPYSLEDQKLYPYQCFGDKLAADLTTCVERGEGVWDRPCRKDSECPFFQANQQDPNYRGGCVAGYCEFPVGVERRSWRKTDPNTKPWCQGCAPEVDPSQCCVDQAADPLLPSPAFAFPPLPDPR